MSLKIQFKKQEYQTKAVQAVIDCFQGQPKRHGLEYRRDLGRIEKPKEEQPELFKTNEQDLDIGFRNADILLTPDQLLKNIQKVQQTQHLHCHKFS